MCGIVGQIYFNGQSDVRKEAMDEALKLLSKRGPDFQNSIVFEQAYLGHARLSILDVSENSNQPYVDPTGRYSLVYNGEIFNFLELKSELEQQGEFFTTSGDTEVLMKLLILKGSEAISLLNGFFAFCFYDNEKKESLIVRDRYGIKPLVYFIDGQKLTFASEIKALNPFIGKQEIDKQSLRYFFQFNYIAAPYTILEGVRKLEPGTFLFIKAGEVTVNRYYTLNSLSPSTDSYVSAKDKVYNLLHEATQRRMISDVPIGTFLSGGIDSSVVSLIASKYTSNLNTFSIGFKDNPFFDETEYAEMVAQKIGSNHSVLKLSNDDLLNGFDDALNYFDEPFADSSALNLFLLTKYTKQHATVALSGDGADELFSGYNKHKALYDADRRNVRNALVKSFASPISSILPKSRETRLGNFGRKLEKYADGLKQESGDRYISWASFIDQEEGNELMNIDFKEREGQSYLWSKVTDFNDYLDRDFKMVLEGDMLRKVDSMSMANSLEVRTPFLDVNLVDYVFSLPASYKINEDGRKRILKDAFKNELPDEIFTRGKKGFEVPLKQWFEKELSSHLSDFVFNHKLVLDQDIFDWEVINLWEKKLKSDNSKDIIYNVWAMLSFQKWLANYNAHF